MVDRRKRKRRAFVKKNCQGLNERSTRRRRLTKESPLSQALLNRNQTRNRHSPPVLTSFEQTKQTTKQQLTMNRSLSVRSEQNSTTERKNFQPDCVSCSVHANSFEPVQFFKSTTTSNYRRAQRRDLRRPKRTPHAFHSKQSRFSKPRERAKSLSRQCPSFLLGQQRTA